MVKKKQNHNQGWRMIRIRRNTIYDKWLSHQENKTAGIEAAISYAIKRFGADTDLVSALVDKGLNQILIEDGEKNTQAPAQNRPNLETEPQQETGRNNNAVSQTRTTAQHPAPAVDPQDEFRKRLSNLNRRN